MARHDVIVIGASAGGVAALQILARGLPEDLAAAVLVVLHTSPDGPYLLPGILSRVGKIPAVKPRDGEPIEQRKIYVAPPGHHLLVSDGRIGLSRGPKENCTRPAIDPLFRTAAATYGPRVAGVILTGMLDDGTVGLAAVKERGGVAVVQDPLDALYPSMPRSALEHVQVDYAVPLAEVAQLLARLVNEPTKIQDDVRLSDLITIESGFAQMKTIKPEEMNRIGDPAGLSCPECYGPLWKIRDGTIHRYRCHVGHAYTAASMMQGQCEAQETSLWQALRLMRERAALLREMERAAQDHPLQDDGRQAQATLAHLEENIALVQKMIQDQEPSDS